MKLTIVVFVTLFALYSFSEAAESQKTLEERRAEAIAKFKPGEMKEMLDRYMGGIIEREGTSKGYISFLNCQTTLAEAVLKDYVAIMRREMRLEMKVQDTMDGFSLDKADDLKRRSGADAAVFVVECNDLPISLVAIDNSWAVVNISPLLNGVPMSIGRERAKKAILRTTAILLGAYDSGTAGNILGQASKPEDYDVFQDPKIIPPTLVAPIGGHMVRAGMKPIVFSSYRKACEAGWAPSPTNDVQKAIWDEIHALPANPKKIKFDPKKGR